MEDLLTLNSSEHKPCVCAPSQTLFLLLVDISTFLIGQPVILRLLWLTLISNKTTDILNLNLAVFHYSQYLVSMLHLIVFFTVPHYHTSVLRFLFVYAQIGGSLSLCFICIQRYVAVIYPSFYPLLKKYRYSEFGAVIMWIMAVSTSVANIATESLSPITNENFSNVKVALLVINIALMGQCSIRVMRLLSKRGPGRDKVHPTKKRAFKTITATSVILLLFYIPVALLQRLVTVDGCGFDCLFTPVCILLLSAASIVHPLFYLSTHGKLFSCFKGEKRI